MQNTFSKAANPKLVMKHFYLLEPSLPSHGAAKAGKFAMHLACYSFSPCERQRIVAR